MEPLGINGLNKVVFYGEGLHLKQFFSAISGRDTTFAGRNSCLQKLSPFPKWQKMRVILKRKKNAPLEANSFL